jgi:hypothetical protein
MEEHPMEDANFATGGNGLIAVDKIGNQILFLDPKSYATTLTLDAFAPRVHELAISPDHRTAYVPIYGDGIHGNNPHPGHLIALFDLVARRHAGDFSTYPYRRRTVCGGVRRDNSTACARTAASCWRWMRARAALSM